MTTTRERAEPPGPARTARTPTAIRITRRRHRAERLGRTRRLARRFSTGWRVAVVAGRVAGLMSRRLGVGSGSMIVGRVALALCPDVLSRLAAGRTSVVVTGTNGKTTTSHLIAAALGARGPVAHNAAGSNMTDGAVAALIEAPRAALAVLEVDELHLGPVLDAVAPDVLVLLNLSRDQLDRVGEVRAIAHAIRELLARHPATVVVGNADDPLAVWAAGTASEVVWVAAGTRWEGDTRTCPRCGRELQRRVAGDQPGPWCCAGCGLGRPLPEWRWSAEGAAEGHGPTVQHGTAAPLPLALSLPGRVNLGNATLALAAAAAIGTDPATAAPVLATVEEVAGRYGHLWWGARRVRVLLVKNPAGWGEALDMIAPGRPVLVAVNAREADGRDVSWLWDLPVDALTGRAVAVAGDRAADVGVRLSYADIAHHTASDPRAALEALPAGDIDALANYTAFLDLRHRLGASTPDHGTAGHRTGSRS